MHYSPISLACHMAFDAEKKPHYNGSMNQFFTSRFHIGAYYVKAILTVDISQAK